VLEGLRSAAGGTDVGALDKAIGGLQKRQFLLVSAKSNQPVLFQTRWAMSYLRGPLTKDQIATLMKDVPRGRQADPAAQETGAPAEPAPTADPTASPVAPPVASDVTVAYLDPAAAWSAQVGAAAGGTRLQAFVAARVSLRFDDTSAGVDEQQEYEALYGPLDGGLDLDSEHAVDYDDRDFRADAPAAGQYVLPSAPIAHSSFFRDAERDITRRLVDRRTLDVFRNRTLRLTSRPGETQEQFLARCDQAAQQAADAEAAAIKAKLEAKQTKLQAALEIAQRRVSELDTQARARQANELIAGAGAVLGALFGGRRSARSITNAIGTVASKRGMSAAASQRRDTAEAKAQQSEDALHEIEQEILDEVQRIDAEWKAKGEAIETVSIRPEAADVRVEKLTLVWVPVP
jgi:hypothetical protein